MEKTIFFVDGFNLYHSLTEQQYHKYKWLNIKKLCESFMLKQNKISAIKYFSALAYFRPDSFIRHQVYIKALQSVGIDVILGKFKRKDRFCLICKKTYLSHEEKRTDVNIAVSLLVSAIYDEYDTAIIVSGDSDLIPAIEAVKTNFPNKKIGIIIPINRDAKELIKISDFHMRIKIKHLNSCQFDDIINIDPNIQLQRPLSWR